MLEYVVKLSCRVAKHLRQPKEAGHAALTRLALDALRRYNFHSASTHAASAGRVDYAHLDHLGLL